MTQIDFREGRWFLAAPALKGEMGFTSLPAATGFAAAHGLSARLTNRAVVRSYAERVL
jgi:hypothetical protein